MPTIRPPLVRWVLLLAVIAGVFGMHVLTPGDGPGHGTLPTAMAADHHTAATAPDPTMTGPATTDPTMTGPAMTGPAMAELPSGADHGDMAGCILFLVVGGAALLLLASARQSPATHDGEHRMRGPCVDLRRRGPPDGWPRLALNVIRV